MEQSKKDCLPPKLREELEAAEKEAVAAQIEFETLIRDFTSPDEILLAIFWQMVEGVEVKQSEAVNDEFRRIAESLEPGFLPKGYGSFYEPIRGFYLTGANDTDRAQTLKALDGKTSYPYANHHFRKKDTPPPTVETLEERYRQYTEARRWLKENRPAIVAARNRLRETGAALDAVQERVREIERAESLGEAGREIQRKIDRARKSIDNLIQRGDKIDRERGSLRRAVEAAEAGAGDTPPDAGTDAGSGESRGKTGEPDKKDTGPKGGGNRYRGRLF